MKRRPALDPLKMMSECLSFMMGAVNQWRVDQNKDKEQQQGE
jgi:hypothetical protein